MPSVTKSKLPRAKITYEPGLTSAPMTPFPLLSPLARYFADFDRFVQNFLPLPKVTEYALWTPEIEAFKRPGEFVIHADLPGLKKEDVKVEIEENTIVVSGERKEEHKEESEGFYRSERRYGNFLRAIPLPETAEADQCKATFENGVLEVVVPIKEEPVAQRKLIEIT